MSTRHSDIKITTIGDNSPYFIELRKQLSLLPLVVTVFHSPFPEIALEAVRKHGANLLIVDLYGVGVTETIELIKKVRLRDRTIPICLAGKGKELRQLPNVPLYWKHHLNQFYKLDTDTETNIAGAAQEIVLQFEKYLTQLEQTPEQQSEKNEIPQAPLNIFAASTLMGALGLSIAEALPIGITGGGGFIMGFIISFLFFSLLLLISELRSNTYLDMSRNVATNKIECPVCRNSLIVTASLYDKEGVPRNRSADIWEIYRDLISGRQSLGGFGRSESGEEGSSDLPEKGSKWR